MCRDPRITFCRIGLQWQRRLKLSNPFFSISKPLPLLMQLPLSRRALMIWPSYRLDDSTRYIVALRGLRTTSGALVQPSAAFRHLRYAISPHEHTLHLKTVATPPPRYSLSDSSQIKQLASFLEVI